MQTSMGWVCLDVVWQSMIQSKMPKSQTLETGEARRTSEETLLALDGSSSLQ